MEHLLELKGVTKRYGDTLALKGVSLSIDKGECIALIGPNGAGKTTLLRVIAGLEQASSGEVLYRGVKAKPSLLRRVATMVFQKPEVFNATVYKNVAYGLKVRGYSKAETDRRVKEALSMVKMEGYEDKQAKKLSGGQQQRLALARALALDVELLLLDEPLSNLDSESSTTIGKLLNWISKERRLTMVVAMHDAVEAMALTDKVALLMGGELISVGHTYTVLKQLQAPLKAFTRLENVFIGEATPNEDGSTSIRLSERLTIEAVGKRTGRVTVFIRPEDVMVSKRPVELSARNAFKGRVLEISDLNGAVRLKVDTGKALFTVQITKKSLIELGINVGSEVFLAFKASSVYFL
ncbi:MAG: ABC transporter ATP-binding protein [Candidatus Nezhaarchaeales archaeon]